MSITLAMHTELRDPLMGQLVAGRYRVMERLGEGGMGHVYAAMHEAIEKRIALKVLKPEYSVKQDIVTRFQQEAISASRIKHPNVLEVFDFGKLDNGCAFLAMEFLSGNDLADELGRLGYINTRRALRISLQICRALAAAHKAHVVHRDMKPDNVFLQRTEDGEEIVKIVDFGIAQLRNPEDEAKSQPTRRRLTKTGMIFGTPEYMAPEQAAGKKADQRVDVYATGIILFEMFTGAVPFTGDSFMAVLAAHLNDPVPSMLQYRPDLEISEELHAVVTRALAKDPGDRFPSMADLAFAIMQTEEGQTLGGIELTIPTLPPPPPGAGPGALTRPHGSGEERDPRIGSTPDAVAAEAAVGADSIPPADGDRPRTLDAATTSGTTKADKKSSAVGPLLGGLFAVAAVAAGAYFVLVPRQAEGDAPAADEASKAAAATAPPEVVSQPPLPVETAAPAVSSAPVVAPAVPEVPKRVTVSVETTPPGAILEKDGFQVCDSTPCDVLLEPGQGVQFVAKLGGRSGAAKVLPQEDQKLMIQLRAPSRPPPKPPQKKMCEVNVNGLKILRECPK